MTRHRRHIEPMQTVCASIARTRLSSIGRRTSTVRASVTGNATTSGTRGVRALALRPSRALSGTRREGMAASPGLVLHLGMVPCPSVRSVRGMGGVVRRHRHADGPLGPLHASVAAFYALRREGQVCHLIYDHDAGFRPGNPPVQRERERLHARAHKARNVDGATQEQR